MLVFLITSLRCKAETIMTKKLKTKQTLQGICCFFSLKAATERWFSHSPTDKDLLLFLLLLSSRLCCISCWAQMSEQLLWALTQANARRATGRPPRFLRRCWSNRPSQLFFSCFKSLTLRTAAPSHWTAGIQLLPTCRKELVKVLSSSWNTSVLVFLDNLHCMHA